MGKGSQCGLQLSTHEVPLSLSAWCEENQGFCSMFESILGVFPEKEPHLGKSSISEKLRVLNILIALWFSHL